MGSLDDVGGYDFIVGKVGMTVLPGSSGPHLANDGNSKAKGFLGENYGPFWNGYYKIEKHETT